MGRGGDTELDGEATPNRGGHDDIEPDTQVGKVPCRYHVQIRMAFLGYETHVPT